jgi:hypothetical protein
MRDAIEIASAAGFTDGELAFTGDNFRRFEALVRNDEREACAKIAWNMEPDENGPIETAIRARGNK